MRAGNTKKDMQELIVQYAGQDYRCRVDDLQDVEELRRMLYQYIDLEPQDQKLKIGSHRVHSTQVLTQLTGPIQLSSKSGKPAAAPRIAKLITRTGLHSSETTDSTRQPGECCVCLDRASSYAWLCDRTLHLCVCAVCVQALDCCPICATGRVAYKVVIV